MSAGSGQSQRPSGALGLFLGHRPPPQHKSGLAPKGAVPDTASAAHEARVGCGASLALSDLGTLSAGDRRVGAPAERRAGFGPTFPPTTAASRSAHASRSACRDAGRTGLGLPSKAALQPRDRARPRADSALDPFAAPARAGPFKGRTPKTFPPKDGGL